MFTFYRGHQPRITTELKVKTKQNGDIYVQKKVTTEVNNIVFTYVDKKGDVELPTLKRS